MSVLGILPHSVTPDFRMAELSTSFYIYFLCIIIIVTALSHHITVHTIPEPPSDLVSKVADTTASQKYIRN